MPDHAQADATRPLFDGELVLRPMPAEVFPPGELIADELAARGMTRGDLAPALGLEPAALARLIVGRLPIGAELAGRLAGAFGADARFWLDLEAAYRAGPAGAAADDAAPPLKRLGYRVGRDLVADVARFRELLNAQGYDADPASIALAYTRFSELEKAMGWEDPERFDDGRIVAGLLGLLEPEADGGPGDA